MNTLYIIGAVFIAAAGFFFFGSTPGAQSETIRIGAVLSLTGNASTDGLSIKRGIDLAVDDLKKRGTQVEVIYQDDGTDAKRTVSALQFLIATENPDAVMGPTWSFLEDAVAPVVKEAKIVAYAPANTSEFVSIQSHYQFQGAPRNALKADPIARWLKENNKKRVAIMVDKTPWGESNAKPFRAAALAAGAEIVIDETFPPFDSNVGGTIATILAKAKAADADVVMWTGYDADATALVQRRETLDMQVPIIAASTVYSSLLSRRVVTAEQLHDVYSVDAPASADFVTKFEAKYGEKPNNFADRAYDGTMMLVEALQNAKTKDGDDIANYLRNNLTYARDGQSYKFNENGDLIGGEWVVKQVIEQ